MNIELEMVKRDDAHVNFIGSIRNRETRRGYARNLKKFLDLIPDEIFAKYLQQAPRSRGVEDLADAFVRLVRCDIKSTKAIIRSYMRQTNRGRGGAAQSQYGTKQAKANQDISCLK